MKPWIWLRIAAILQAFFALGHTLGGTPRKAIRGPQEEALFAAMQSFRFDVMGSTRSHWEFYQGFSLMIGVNFAILAVLMWQLSTFSKTDAERTRPLILTLLVCEIGMAVLGWEYFFLVPTVFAIVISLCLAVAALGAKSETKSAIATQHPIRVC